METVSLSGKELAAGINADTRARVAALAEAGGAPRLVLVVANDDEASAWYVRSLSRAAGKLGIECEIADLGVDATAESILAKLAGLSDDPTVDAIMLQTPLPKGVGLLDVSPAIAAAKDVDGASPLSLGLLAAGLPGFGPATAEAVVALLDHHGVELSGREVAVIGRSNVVGKPLAQLLLAKDATVTVCHSRTRDLAAVVSRAEVVVAAVGRAELIGAEHLAAGAVVVDVGTNPTEEGGLVGDVAADAVQGKVGALSPVPGGVGPVTTALLMRHTVAAAETART